MHCTQCGTAAAADAAFCAKCGAKLTPGAPTPFKPGVAPANDPEIEIWRGSTSWKALYPLWAACFLAVIAVAVLAFAMPPALIVAVPAAAALWLGTLGAVAYRRMDVHYKLTNQRFFHERGILRRVTDRIEVIDIDDIEQEQGLIERILGIGTIRISSSDRTDPEFVLKCIDQVAEVAAKIDQARRNERTRRGVYVESV